MEFSGGQTTAQGQGEVQTGAPVQGDPTAQNGAKGTQTDGVFNWDLFPGVPEDQRGLLEPHLRNVQGHVTRMEQEYAPVKTMLQQAGIEPGDMSGVVQFASNFSADPMQAWLGLAQNMQNAGIIDQDLDLNDLTAIVKGEYFDDEDDSNTAAQQTNGQVDPNIQALMDEVRGLKDELQQRDQREQQTRQTRTQQALLSRTLTSMREQLKAANIPEDQVTDELLKGQLIAHKGDATKAISAITGFRDGASKAVIDNARQDESELVVNGGLPKGTGTAKKKSSSRDAFSEANVAAEQMLRQNQAAAAREG